MLWRWQNLEKIRKQQIQEQSNEERRIHSITT
jgi:hypothetical protein